MTRGSWTLAILVLGAAACRPETPAAAREIVERVSGAEHPLLKTDFYNSLCAAFTADSMAIQ